MNMDINLRIFSSNRNISVNKQWVQFGIIVTAILASIVVSYWGSIQILTLLLVLLCGLAVALTWLRQPAFGLVLVFLGGMFVPFIGPR